MDTTPSRGIALLLAVGLLLVLSLSGTAAPGDPAYMITWTDAITGDNEFASSGDHYWDVDPDADVYQDDVYERPTAQTYTTVGGKYAASEYFGYLDIVEASLGWDSQYLYVSINMFSLDKVTNDGVHTEVGLVERYGFRLGADADGRYSTLFVADQPELKNDPNTDWGSLGTFAYRDTNGDVGGRGALNGNPPSGRSETKSDNPAEEWGMDGYDTDYIADGALKDGGTQVLWTRINPLDSTIVEFALDYQALMYTSEFLSSMAYIEFEAIKGGPKDPKNYLWNDKYTGPEAGSPNPGMGGLSEFGTQGCGNIYELDTLRGGVVPEPAGLLALLGGAGTLGAMLFRKMR